MKITPHKTLSATKARTYTSVSFDDTRDYARIEVQPDGTSALSVGCKGLLPLTRRRCAQLVRKAIQHAKAQQCTHVAFDLDTFTALNGFSLEQEDFARLFAENAHLAHYEYDVYKTADRENEHDIVDCAVVGASDASAKAGLVHGTVVAKEVNACRTLANTPGGDMTPQVLAARIRASAKGTLATVRVLGKKEMETLGMGALLGVSRGTNEPPKFIVVEYKGAKNKKAPVVLVGKGVTYDTGGLSLKPSRHMLDMHHDMAGGAAVAHAVFAAARLKLPVHVIALVPAVENAVSSESYRPGDILTSMSGKTIDVLDTDAEGRLLLADALTYAKRYKPSLVVDVATLTGAALSALGTKASAVMSPDDALSHELVGYGEEGGDYLWPLPLWEEYKGMVKGRFGDVANMPVVSAQYAGTIGAGMFLAEFVDEYPWAHIDMAPRMTSDKTDGLAEGATGEPVRMLVRLLEHRS